MTGDTFKINHSLNCDDKCLIYLMTCKQCNKQYTGETTDLFRNRWNNYKDNARKFDRKESCMQEHLYKHFQTEGHKGFLNEVSVTFIDKTDGKNPKKRERYWMRTLKKMESYGLHIADIVLSADTLFRLFIDYYFQPTITFIVYYFYSYLDLFIYLLLLLFYFLL